jgi:hypothetical protein
MSVLEFAPTGIFQMRHYRIAHDGGAIDCGRMREQATITIGGAFYTAAREGLLSSTYYLQADGNRLASAVVAGALKGGFIVQTGGRTFTLARAPAFGRAFALTENGLPVGSIGRSGFFSRRSKAELPDDLAPAIKAFLIWLIIIVWQRQVMTAGMVSGVIAGGR